MEERPVAEPVAEEVLLGGGDGVGRALVLGEPVDQPQDGRHVGGDGIAEAERGGHPSEAPAANGSGATSATVGSTTLNTEPLPGAVSTVMLPAVGLDDGAADVQPEPRPVHAAAARRGQAAELLEEPRHLLGRDPRARSRPPRPSPRRACPAPRRSRGCPTGRT